MQTIIRNGRIYHEYTPEELDESRLQNEIAEMHRTGRIKSTHGAVNAGEFVPDLGSRKARHKAH